MSNRKFRDLPLYTGSTTGTYLILNNSSQTTTYKVTKETLFSGFTGGAGSAGTSGTSGSSGTRGSSGSSGTAGTSGTSGLAGDLYRTTSSTSLTIQTGTTGTFVIGTGLGYSVAQDVIIAYDISNHMVGMVTSYNPSNGQMVINVHDKIGSGTYTGWSVNLNGAAGGDGSSGTSGTSGSSGSAGTSGAATINSNIANYILTATGTSGLVQGQQKFQFDGTTMTLSGSMVTTGSNNLIGITHLTGSVYITGSSSIIGNTVISGSLDVSGSNNFNGATKVSGAFYIASSSLFSQGTGSALIAYDTGSGQLYHTTYQSAFPALMGAGAFYSTESQSGSMNVSSSFTLNGTLNVNTVHIESGSHIVCDKPGTYNIQFSIQIVQGAGAANLAIWLKKNGTNVPYTATYVTVPSNTNQLFALNVWDVTTNTSDYFEIVHQSDSPHTTYSYVPSTGNIPGSPSIIVTVNQVR